MCVAAKRMGLSAPEVHLITGLKDFEEAGRLRDREKELLTEKETREGEIKGSGVDLFDEVDDISFFILSD